MLTVDDVCGVLIIILYFFLLSKELPVASSHDSKKPRKSNQALNCLPARSS